MRREANELLEGEDLLDTGGLTIHTTLDYRGYQRFAEKWARIGYDMDRLSDERLVEKYGEEALAWIKQLQGRNINNDAIVTVNYRTGAVLAYVGSAAFYGKATPEHQPNFDVIGQAYRQSGSAFKPITYATGFETGVISPATMFMDVRTDIADGFNPPNADNRERGPVRVRDALKYSLNIPVTKAQQLIGTENVVAMAQRLGLQFDPRHNGEFAVPSLTLGTLGIHQIDLAGAYGAIANQGRLMEPYLIERIEDSDGNVIYDHATDAGDGEQVLSAASAYLVTDILADNTDPATNPLWGPRFQLQTDDGGRRPATLKTGTTNDFKDLQAYGYLAGNPDDPEDPTGAIVTGRLGRQQRLQRDPGRVRGRWADVHLARLHGRGRRAQRAAGLRLQPTRRRDRSHDRRDERPPPWRAHVDHRGRARARRRAAHRFGHDPSRTGDRSRVGQDLAGGLRRLRGASTFGVTRSRGVAPTARAGPPGLPRPRRLGIRSPVMGRGESRLARALERPGGGAEQHAARTVPWTDRRAAGPAGGMHAGRVPDLHAEPVSHADAVSNPNPVPHSGADPDAAPR